MRGTVIYDLDSSLAAFCRAFTGAAVRLGRYDRVHGEEERDRWAFQFPASRVWRHVYESPDFWLNIEPLWRPEDAASLDRLGRDFHVMYVTARDAERGTTVRQTHAWIERHGLPSGPVFFSQTSDKSDVVLPNRHQVVGMLEDKPEVLTRLSEAGVPVVARAWPYNADVPVPHVTNVTDFAQLVYGYAAEVGA